MSQEEIDNLPLMLVDTQELERGHIVAERAWPDLDPNLVPVARELSATTTSRRLPTAVGAADQQVEPLA